MRFVVNLATNKEQIDVHSDRSQEALIFGGTATRVAQFDVHDIQATTIFGVKVMVSLLLGNL